jgi:hypothetical protein
MSNPYDDGGDGRHVPWAAYQNQPSVLVASNSQESEAMTLDELSEAISGNGGGNITGFRSSTLGDGVHSSFTITHNLNDYTPIVNIWNSGQQLTPGIDYEDFLETPFQINNANQNAIVVTFFGSPALGDDWAIQILSVSQEA